MSDINNNLEFWESVQTTDPAYAKDAQVGGQFRTMVDAQYKKKMITKQFGMYGMGWGVLPESEIYERIEHPMTMLLVYRATAFYVVNKKQFTFPIAAAIKEYYVTKNGAGYAKIDDEAVKKVRTDALTKGFTDLGFNTDIHMGMWEDQDYIAAINLANEISTEESEEAQTALAQEKISEYMYKQVEFIETITSKTAYVAAMRNLVPKIRKRCAAAKINSAAFVETLTDLVNEKQNTDNNEGEK